MIKLNNIKMPVGSGVAEIKAECARRLGIAPEMLEDFSLSRLSVDARRRSAVHLVCSAVMKVQDQERLLAALPKGQGELYIPKVYDFPQVARKSSLAPVIVGMGPGGLFCALELARAGLKPIILERGRPVEERAADVERFWSMGVLDTNSNVQFGEGGAGAFSDGKLNTGINDPRTGHVLRTLVSFGAPKDILWSAKPHVGTDVLRQTVANIRGELLRLGCDIRFEHCLKGLIIRDDRLEGIKVSSPGGDYEAVCDCLVLAPGHSARDTFEMLHASGVKMEQKAFAVGVRIEHLQEKISRVQYGESSKLLPPADYKLSCHLPDGRGVYSFCVCPGGQVVAAASEEDGIVTNGMSYRARDGKNINGGLLVSVGPGEFQSDDPLAGMRFQRMWEKRAYAAGGGGYIAPCQTVGDFLEGRSSRNYSAVEPSYRPNVRMGHLDEALPGMVSHSLKQALPLLDRQLKGFAASDAVMTGTETRSSSPVRILRGPDFQSVTLKGLYPCGEGAGYAGGISSAAVDGIKVAEAVAVFSGDD